MQFTSFSQVVQSRRTSFTDYSPGLPHSAATAPCPDRSNDSKRLVDRLTYFAFTGLLIAITLIAPPRAGAAIPFEFDDEGVPTLSRLIERVTPAVVNISVTSRVNVQLNPLFRDPFFRRFFNMPEQAPQQQASVGSGVIVDAKKGYVITNHHVIDNADEIRVTLKDRRVFEAKLIGSDPGTDIALLKINNEDLVGLPFGDSDALAVGDFVVAVGNPFGIGQTVTSGIVSALGRSGLKIDGYEDFIQTDASINPGNSGGALVSLSGELIGINTAIIGPGGGNVGIGFAVPSKMAIAVMDQLVEHGEVRRGRLGVVIQDVTPDLVQALGIDTAKGALVSQVVPDSSAEQAGIKVGDVIVRVDGKDIEDSADLRNTIGLVPIDQEIEIRLLRDGEENTLMATVGAPTDRPSRGETAKRLSGAVFQDLGPDHPRYGEIEGVLIADVEPNSPAWRTGLRPGDIVLSVNRERVSTVKEMVGVLNRTEQTAALRVARGDSALFIVVR